MGNCIGVDEDSKPKSSDRTRSKKIQSSQQPQQQQQQQQRSLLRALSSSSASSVDSSDSCSSKHRNKSLVREASMEILPGSSDGITRLKLVISKQQVDDIVSGDYSSSSRLDFFDNLLTSMLKQELQQANSS